MSLTTVLKFKKSTKRTHVYENTSPDAPISVLYITKESLSKFEVIPLKLTITVEESK